MAIEVLIRKRSPSSNVRLIGTMLVADPDYVLALYPTHTQAEHEYFRPHITSTS